MRISHLALPLFVLVLLACGNKGTSPPAQELYGSLNLSFVDSFHLNDSTTALASNVAYQITNDHGLLDRGTLEITPQSQVGDTDQIVLNRVAAGLLNIRYTVSRPFIIIGRKDDTSKARFSDTTSVDLLANGEINVTPVDIWAYRLDQLILYFDQNIEIPQAESIIASLGATVLSQRISAFDGSLIYGISTQGLGNESDLKQTYERIPGIRSVFFSIIGHSYF
jgi:hypothetical protein